jgi:hypothetical protein|tara:strand:+ start:1384 stop:2109 length:726 start_codon:yes stop_codon:yes gene_type:complete
MALPKWTDERTQQLVDFVGEGPISQAQVADAADELETSTRSVSSKLRKMGYEVELASSVSTKSFSDEQEATLEAFVTDNSGQYTYAEIADSFEGGHFSAKSIQGKILSMELTSHVKPAEKQESVRTYSPEEEATFINMVNDNAFVEEIADALGKSVNSIRGKALSLLRSGDINAIPKQKETKGSSKADPLSDLNGELDGMTVEEIADEIGKTVRGVKTMLTRRGLTCADYDGAARKEKASS